MALLASMEDPEMVVQSDELCVSIKDAYPKARYHYLVLPRAGIASLRSLDRSHLDLLKHMLECGQKLVSEASSKEPHLKFRLGYHAVPSMTRLHMHVISQDFDSPCLKTKKHWNSFTSDFFIGAKRIIKMMEEEGRVELDVGKYEELLKRPLRCHVCQRSFANMPQLKDHIKVHDKK